MKNCKCNHELPRDGSGQAGRYLKALDPSFAPIDGRSIEELLVFAKRYAAQIRFYDLPESRIDDDTAPEKVSWLEFFRRDMAVIAASISLVDTAKLKGDYDENREKLESQPASTGLHDLFQQIIGIVVQIDHWYGLAIQDNPFHADLELAINSTLRNQLMKIVAYEEAYRYIDPKHPLQLDFSAIDNSALWGLDDSIAPDPSIYQGSSLDEKICSAALYVDDIFHVFFGFLTDLVEVKSPQYMSFALESYPAHQPHLTLFITFLELFRIAQEQMNGLTERILSFYYNDVLRLAPHSSIADRVYIVFELAKDIVGYDLSEGTLLKAGKDASGIEQSYVTQSDLVINQAKVKELKTLFVQKSSSGDRAKGMIDAIFARPVANSFDGFGEPITDPSGKWPTFGKGIPDAVQAVNICQKIDQYKENISRKDQAQIGFAIASPQLLLQGGNRLILWRMTYLENLLPTPAAGSSDAVEIWLTAEKGWLKIDNVLDEQAFSMLGQASIFGIFHPKLAESGSGYYIDRTTDTLFIYLSVVENAIVPFDGKLHTGYSYDTSYPVVQFMLPPSLSVVDGQFRDLDFLSHSLCVKVGSINPSNSDIEEWHRQGYTFPEGLKSDYYFDGLKTFVLQNETGLLSAAKPFDPFTLYPGYGKSFYVGSEEVFNKPLVKLAVDIRKTRESEAVIPVLNNLDKSYNVSDYDAEYSLSLRENKQWGQLSNEQGSWQFARQHLTKNILNKTSVLDDGILEGKPFLFERKPLATVTEFRADSIKGFIRVTNLKEVYASGNIPLIQASQNLAPELQISELSVSYYSELWTLDPLVDQFFHIYPFGLTEVFISKRTEQSLQYLSSGVRSPLSDPTKNKLFETLDKAKDYLLVNANGTLLPQFTWLSPDSTYQSAFSEANRVKDKLARKDIMETLVLEASGVRQTIEGGNNQYSGTLQEEGMLFIGLEKLQPLDTLSLLFQFAEGSADDEDNDPPEIHWSYLSNNEWRPLKAENLISDGTNGFQTTGIIKLEVPEDSSDHNTIITDGLRWFCASVTENSNRIPMLVNIVAQAVEASFQDNGNDQSHFDKALAAGSISKLAVAVSQVSKVEQPFASFDGKHQEAGKEFYTRVSERLRHKARAITPWDYEHLVLDRFPSIYKVKCITHTDPNCLCRQPEDESERLKAKVGCCGPQIAPGHVLVVPIANLQNRNAANPLQPKTSCRTLLDIEDYLQERSSPFVKVHAKNPVYEQVLVFFRVQFIAGADKGYYLKKLNEEIVHYLTPWAFDENAELSFARKFYASSIINFIEEHSWVDFITDFFMFVCRDECCPAKVNASVKSEAETTATFADMLMNITGCCDLEEFIAKSGNFIGEVIAEPSTSRSILVSAPQHIILPYEAPAELSACQKRKTAGARVDTLPIEGMAKPELLMLLKELPEETITANTQVKPPTGKRRKK
ncbi:MAG: hypothetical protein WCK85_00660 [Chlorobium sp.]